jgi:hypothetical protein
MTDDEKLELAKAMIAPIRCGGLDYCENSLGERISYLRVSGKCICFECGKTFLQHPLDMSILDNTGEPWLNILCNGRRVKL